MKHFLKSIFHDRYLVFSFNEYYPSGGLDDSVNRFNRLRDAIEFAKGEVSDGYPEYEYVYDRLLNKITWINPSD